MSDTPENVLQEFQQRVQDLELSAATCLRFLLAKNFDFDKAEDMIRKAEKWREETDIREIYKSIPPEMMEPDFRFQFMGPSLKGGPVFWIPLGQWNARYWIDRGETKEVIRCGYRMLESILSRIQQMDDRQGVAIIGMEELTYYKTANLNALKVLYDTFQTFERNYPEILQDAFILNAPWIFRVGFNFIKPILSDKTLSKMQVFGSEKDLWLAALKNSCPEDTIPKQYL